MRLPYWTFLALFAVGALPACGGNSDDEDTPTGDDDDDDDDTAPSGDTAEDRKMAAEVRFVGYIAWDSGSRTVVDPIIDGSDGFISAYVITLYEEGWTSADESTFCRIAIPLVGFGSSPDAVADGYLWGLDIPEGPKVDAFSDCIEKDFWTGQFVKGDPLNDWGILDWQLRFGGTKSADLVDWLTPDSKSSDFDIDQYAAGGWSTQTGGYEVDDDDNYWYAYDMDIDGNVILDVSTRLTDVEMSGGPGDLTRGYYVFDQRVFWTLTE